MIVINTGATANDGTGTALRDAFIIVNQNFLDIQDILDVVLTDSSIISISQISGLQTILDDLSYQVSLIPGLQDDINSINSTIFTINQTLNSQNSSINELYSLVNDLQQQIFTKIGEAPIDGQQYVRQDAGWVVSTGGGTFSQLLENVTPNAYQGLRLQPASASNNGFYINKSVNASVGYYARNTDNVGNGAISSFYVCGTGSNLEENISSFFAANNGYYVPYLRNKSGIYTDRDFFFIGAAGSSFNFVTGTGEYGTETSKFRITNSGTVSIGVQPTLDNDTTDILGRKADGTIVRIDKSSIVGTASYLPLAGGTMSADADIFFTNGSKLSEGIVDAGGDKGIALTCAVGYEWKWEAGEAYLTNLSGNIVELKQYARAIPLENDDVTKGFTSGSYWITLGGQIYQCTDATIGAAVWVSVQDFGTLQVVTDNGSTTTNSITADGGFFTTWDLGSFGASPNGFDYNKSQIVDDEDRTINLTGGCENGFQMNYQNFTTALQSYITQKNDVSLGANQVIDDVTVSNYLTVTTTETLTPKKIVTFEGFEGNYFQFLGLTNSGRFTWNDADGTADLTLKGGNVTLQVGQEQVLRVVNKTSTNIDLLESNYQAVRITGAQGQRLKVDLAQATTDNLSAETIGLVTETIANNQEGFITTSGLVRGINTTGSLQSETWADGDILYLSPTVAGRITNIKPSAPNHMVIIGYVVRAHITQGSIFVKVDNGYELDELHNVKITGTPSNNSLLAYGTSSVWENKTLEQIGGSINLISDGLPGTPVTGGTSLTRSLIKSYFIPANTFAAGDTFEIWAIGSKVNTNTSFYVSLNINTSNTIAGATEIGRAFTNNVNITYMPFLRVYNFTTGTNLRGAVTNSGSNLETNLTGTSVSNTTFNTAVDNWILFAVTPVTGGTADIMNIEKVIIRKNKYKVTV